MTISPFITRWTASAAAERANYQLFLSELCDALDVPRPDPTVADEAANAYVFEKAVPLPQGSTGRIDLYRRGCFVLEAKQGSEQHQPPALSLHVQERRRRRRGTAALVALVGPATAEQVAAAFVDAPAERVAELLETLAGLGQAAAGEDRCFSSSNASHGGLNNAPNWV